MKQIISFANHKGGVSKTTSVSSLGVALSQMGKKVLLIDLDPQTNLSDTFTGERSGESVIDLIRKGGEIPVIKIREGLDLCPGSLDLVGIDSGIEIPEGDYISGALRSAKYDLILIDCPPSLGRLTKIALSVSDKVIIPLTPEAYPAKGLGTLLKVIDMVRNSDNPDLALWGIVITRYQRRKVNRLVEESLRETFGDIVFKTKIRENVDITESPLQNKDIFSYSPESLGAKDYTDLAKEVLSKLK